MSIADRSEVHLTFFSFNFVDFCHESFFIFHFHFSLLISHYSFIYVQWFVLGRDQC